MDKVKLCLLALLLCVMTGCQDDDSFSTNVSNILSFSADTVKLDTVFSAVPTTTRTFWVHNESGDGIRCTNIRLERGNQSGFRVNVDGVYLGSESGYQASEVEIRKGDSIRVFVELTSPVNGRNKPWLVEDNLLFLLESGVTQKVNLNAYSWDAIKYRNLHITNDTTLTGDRPIIVYGKLTVEEHATLTLAAGTTLYFHDGGGIDVYGRLCSQGEAGKEVILRGDRLDWMFDYLPYDLMSGLWDGIHFYETSYDNVMEFTDLHSSFNGIVCDSADVEKQKLTLKNMTVHNCQGKGLSTVNCKVTAENCQFTNTLYECVDILGGDVTMNHCTLAQFYPFDSNRRPALNYYSTTTMPLLRMDCINSIVTGYPEDVVMGATENEDIPFNYRFISSILRTPAVEDAEHIIDVIFENVEDTASVQGDKHFKLVDINTQHYDFHLDSLSPAINKGSKDYPVSDDRDGKARDDQPDIGCFEESKPET
jgi:hypothetical protein